MTISVIFALTAFALLLAAEEQHRTDREALPDLRRLSTNWGLALANWLLGALVPLGALAAALAAPSGPLTAMPALLAVPPLLLARSLGTYGLHRLSHAVPALWRLHRVHHADTGFDLSTGLRNHPIEMLLATLLAAGITGLLAPPPAAVVVVDGLILAAAFWTHAAIALPPRAAALLERVIITPRLHIIHHSRDAADHDRNFGDTFIVWDRLFGTFKPARADAVRVGLDGEDGDAGSLWRQLALPFTR